MPYNVITVNRDSISLDQLPVQLQRSPILCFGQIAVSPYRWIAFMLNANRVSVGIGTVI
jgi:hypothetical protein